MMDCIIPILLMLIPQAISVGINIFCKLAIMDSMAIPILTSYRFIFGAISLAPLVIYKSRISRPTKPTWELLWLTLAYGLLGGSLFQNTYLVSMASTSATITSATINLTPALAFLLGLAFRLESLSGQSYAKTKVSGVLLSIVAVALLAFVRRLEIHVHTGGPKLTFLHHEQQQKHGNQTLGFVLALIATLSNASFLTLQAKFEVDCDNVFLIPFLMNLVAAILSVVYALFVERDTTQWKLGWNVGLGAASFAGVLGSGLSTTIVIWCNSKKGPLFVSAFNPLGLVLMAAIGCIFLGEKLFATSLAAIILIVVAVLMILLGKVKELSYAGSKEIQLAVIEV